MQDNEGGDLGVQFNDIMDLDQLIDTETGQLVGNDNVPKGPKEDLKGGDPPKDPDEGLIDVNIDTKEPGSHDDALGGKGDGNLLLNNKVLENISRALYEKGVISELDEDQLEKMKEGDGAEIIIELLKSQISRENTSYKDSLPDKLKKAIENYEAGVPLDILIGLESADTRLENVTEEQVKENEDIQKILVGENLKRLGLSQTKVNKRVQQFIDLGQLEEEALEALTEGRQYVKESLETEQKNAVKRKEDAETNRLKSLSDLEKDINATTEFISGMKVSDREKQIIYDSMTKAVSQDDQGNPMNKVMVTRSKNPLGFEKLLHYYHNLGLFDITDDGKLSPSISKIKAGAKASAMDELN